MAVYYECYYCKEVFPASDAIDGYQKGYKTGFLCPKCGKNIQAGLQAKAKISTEQYKWTSAAFLLFLPTIFTLDSELEYTVFAMAINLNTLFFSGWLLFIFILWLSKPSLFSVTTFFTEPVNRA